MGTDDYDDKNKTHTSSCCSFFVYLCCVPCKVVYCCGKCLAHILIVRQLEACIISIFNSKIFPFVAGAALATPLGILLVNYGSDASSAAANTGSLVVQSLARIPQHVTPALGMI